MSKLHAIRFALLALLYVAYALASRAQDFDGSGPLLTVDRAVQIAIENNLDLKIAGLETEKSKWQVAGSKTQLLPSFNTYIFGAGLLANPAFLFKEGSLGKINGDPVPATNTKIALSPGFSGYVLAQFAQPITHLYKIHLSIREQELSAEINSEQYRGTRQNVVANVKQAYYAVLQTESSLEATRSTVKQLEEAYRITKQYLAQKAVLKSDTLEVEAKLAQANYQIAELQNDLQTQKEQLNYFLARDLETDFRIEQVPAASLEETDLKVAQQTALSHRPEIRESEINIKKADYDRKLAKAQYIPDISAAVHYFTPLNTELLPTNVAAFGVEMNWEPFEWGRRRDEVKKKEIVEDQARYQQQQTRSQVLMDVNSHYRKLSQSRQMLAVAQVAKEAENEKLREVTEKFSREAVLLRDVLQQQTAVAKANHDYEEALLSFWTAKANFEKALGTS